MPGKMLQVVGGVVCLTVFAAGAALAAGKDGATYDKDVKKIISER